MDEVLEKTAGNNTLVISEGYAFNESMINFVVADGTPRFELHEEKQAQGFRGKDDIYIDSDGNTWIRRGKGPLIEFP